MNDAKSKRFSSVKGMWEEKAKDVHSPNNVVHEKGSCKIREFVTDSVKSENTAVKRQDENAASLASVRTRDNHQITLGEKWEIGLSNKEKKRHEVCKISSVGKWSKLEKTSTSKGMDTKRLELIDGTSISNIKQLWHTREAAASLVSPNANSKPKSPEIEDSFASDGYTIPFTSKRDSRSVSRRHRTETFDTGNTSNLGQWPVINAPQTEEVVHQCEPQLSGTEWESKSDGNILSFPFDRVDLGICKSDDNLAIPTIKVNGEQCLSGRTSADIEHLFSEDIEPMIGPHDSSLVPPSIRIENFHTFPKGILREESHQGSDLHVTFVGVEDDEQTIETPGEECRECSCHKHSQVDGVTCSDDSEQESNYFRYAVMEDKSTPEEESTIGSTHSLLYDDSNQVQVVGKSNDIIFQEEEQKDEESMKIHTEDHQEGAINLIRVELYNSAATSSHEELPDQCSGKEHVQSDPEEPGCSYSFQHSTHVLGSSGVQTTEGVRSNDQNIQIEDKNGTDISISVESQEKTADSAYPSESECGTDTEENVFTAKTIVHDKDLEERTESRHISDDQEDINSDLDDEKDMVEATLRLSKASSNFKARYEFRSDVQPISVMSAQNPNFFSSDTRRAMELMPPPKLFFPFETARKSLLSVENAPAEKNSNKQREKKKRRRKRRRCTGPKSQRTNRRVPRPSMSEIVRIQNSRHVENEARRVALQELDTWGFVPLCLSCAAFVLLIGCSLFLSFCRQSPPPSRFNLMNLIGYLIDFFIVILN